MSHTLMWFTIIDDLEGDSPESIERNLDIKKAEVWGESDENAGIIPAPFLAGT